METIHITTLNFITHHFVKTDLFVKRVRERMARSMSVLDSKRKEYVFNDNPFQNFEAGVGLSVVSTREAVTYGYAVKHLQSVRAIIDNFESGESLPDKEVIQEKFGDAINYLIILEQMLLEHLED